MCAALSICTEVISQTVPVFSGVIACSLSVTRTRLLRFFKTMFETWKVFESSTPAVSKCAISCMRISPFGVGVSWRFSCEL